jgi:hypothetical protein
LSNHLAAAAVTATLRKTLQAALDDAVPGIANARVTTLRPSEPGADLPTPGVNIFLYRVSPSGPLRNVDLPTRRSDGSVMARPTAAVELHYLVSFHGDEGKLEPQILLGIVVRALHSQPVITRAMIEAMLADSTFTFMAGTDLQDAPDVVRLTTIPLSLEELSKLWSVVFQTPYVLSQVYVASAVLLDGVELPAQALRVARTSLTVDASMGPVIDELQSQAAPDGPFQPGVPVATGNQLVLVGRDLLSDITSVQIGTVELIPDPESASSTLLQVEIPPTVPAGPHDVTVVQRKRSTPSATDRRSNSVSLQLQPAITASFAAGVLTVGFTPPVGQSQRVSVILDQLEPVPGQTPKAFAFDVPARSSAIPAASIDVPISGVAAGIYLVRARVDGAESSLTIDPATGRYGAPQVTVP